MFRSVENDKHGVETIGNGTKSCLNTALMDTAAAYADFGAFSDFIETPQQLKLLRTLLR